MKKKLRVTELVCDIITIELYLGAILNVCVAQQRLLGTSSQ